METRLPELPLSLEPRNLVNYASLLWNSTAKTMKGRKEPHLSSIKGKKKKKKKEEKKNKRKGGSEACGREGFYGSLERGWIDRRRPSFSSSTRGIGRADQLRTIRIAFGILSNGVPKLASSSIQSLSSEKKEKKKKKQLESFPFSLSLRFASSCSNHQSLLRPPSLISVPRRDRGRFRPRKAASEASIWPNSWAKIGRRRGGKLGQVSGRRV